jgi:sialate O-acetylesterase
LWAVNATSKIVAIFAGFIAHWPSPMKIKSLLCAALAASLFPRAGLAGVTLPSIFSDHAVLQKSNNVPVWGKAEPGESVRVSLDKASASAVAGTNGKWRATLDLSKAGPGPFELIVEGKNKVVFSDVLVGEVWLASGQSNMEWPAVKSLNGPAEVAAAADTELRLFQVTKKTATAPAEDVQGTWRVCSPEAVRAFSAVAYFFGRELRARLQTPVGLIHSSWGGTPVEAWTPLAEFQGPEHKELREQRAVSLAPQDSKTLEEYQRSLAEWERKIDDVLAATVEPPKEWSDPAMPAADWKTLPVPGGTDRTLPFPNDGAYWLRRVIDLPESIAGGNATLKVGAIDDFDSAWINGKPVGHTGRDTQNFSKAPRNYPLPAGTLHPGPNVILIRVIDRYAGTRVEGPMSIAAQSGREIPLDGEWQGRVDLDLGRSPESRKRPPHVAAGALYDGMIAPLVPYAIRGAIWYQGENNVGRAASYRRLFPNMIATWRKAWDRGDFPFYYVQLANFLPRNPRPGDSAWAELREAQLLTLAFPNTGMASAIDIGEADNIHPINKQEVGRRLALIALAKDYGADAEYSGPLYRDMEIEGGRVRLRFDHATGGLVNTKAPGPIEGFAIAGKDLKFVWAGAEIDGDAVLVSSAEVPNPVAVRYGWADNPAVSLANGAGLPASPFRTDEITRTAASPAR